MGDLWDRAKKYLRRYLAKPGRHRRDRAEYFLNTTILDMLRNWRRSWDHSALHVFVRAASIYARPGAVHWGDWYDEPTAPWAVIGSAPWWTPLPVGSRETMVSLVP